MNLLLLNVLLALAWAALMGQFDVPTLIFGFILGYFALWLTARQIGPNYFRKMPLALLFFGFYLRELVLANLRVARIVLSRDPKKHLRPAIVAVPLSLRSRSAAVFLANMLTLTPGTLSVDISNDLKTLFLHTLFLENPDVTRREIKDGYERRIKELFET